jgi:hypothetical protein
VNPPARRLAAPFSAALLLALAGAACHTPEPKALLDTNDVDAYWAVEPSMAGEQYIAPAVKFHLHNKSGQAQHSVQAMAVFRRKGEENLSWGSAFEQAASRKAPLAPGQSMVVTLTSDARYHSGGAVEGMLTHPQFKDALVEFFLRVGSSGWVSFGQVPVERRIGARGVASAAPPPAPAPSPSTPLAPSARPR